MTTEHVSVERGEIEALEYVMRKNAHLDLSTATILAWANELAAILSRATPSDTSFASGLVNEGLDYFYKAGDEGDKEYVRAIRAHIAALEKPSAPRVVTDEDVERAEQAVSQALGDAYDCTRVWEAWSYGTMSEEDFIEVRQQPERLNEIAMAVIESFSVFMTQPMVTDDLVDRLKTACRALIRERVVYAEDVETLADVVKLMEAIASQPHAAREGFVWVPVDKFAMIRQALHRSAPIPEVARTFADSPREHREIYAFVEALERAATATKGAEG